MNSRLKSRWGWITLSVAVITVLLMVTLVLNRQFRQPLPATSLERTFTPIATPQPPSPSQQESGAPRLRAVFIGDSYTAGDKSWAGIVAKRQGWALVNLARGGTGYLTDSTNPKACGRDYCPNYFEMVPEAVKTHPDIVVVAGGRNDGQLNVTTGVNSVFTGLRKALPKARIIAVQPMWDASSYPKLLESHAGVIQKSVESVNGEYLTIGTPLEGHPELVQQDKVHPTPDGQRTIAAAVNKALQRSSG